MKYQHRLAMLSSVGGVTIVYLLLVYSQGSVHDWNSHPVARHRRSLFADYEFDPQSWSPNENPLLCDIDDNRQHDANNNSSSVIYTIDLPQNTNFKVYSNKQYKLPHPSHDESENEKINVIILPHSHVDAGWLRTIEEYYVYNVKNILNNMVEKLSKFENMTFVWAETVFLSMWWNELDDHVKVKVQNLIKNGQLEIALGAWVMADEASTHYVSVIDQLTEGQQWVWKNLKTKPTNSWSIDPFGHSGTMPYLWKKAGIDNMVIQRVHQAIKATLAEQKSLEFKWRQFWDDKGTNDILCHVMPYLYYGMQHTCGPDSNICAMYDYGTPKGFNEEPTGKFITDQNIERQAHHLQTQYRMKASLYKYNTVLVPLGDDFRFDKAEEWDFHYHNYAKLMEYINSRKDWNMNMQFGTLTDYFKLVKDEEAALSKKSVKNKFPLLSGDFFPYSDLDSDYWTGYYSTRAFDKQLSRDVEANLRAADLLNTLAHVHCKSWGVPYDNFHEAASQLQLARRSLSLFLHHDAITGTSKPNVMLDYEKKLLEAFNQTQSVISESAQTLLTRGKLENPTLMTPEVIRVDTISSPITYTMYIGNNGVKVIFFNPLAQTRTEFVKVVTSTGNIEIKTSENLHIPYQVNPVFKTTTTIHESEFEIVFLVELPPFALETFSIDPVPRSHMGQWAVVSTYNGEAATVGKHHQFQYTHSTPKPKEIYIENKFMKAEFNNTGMLYAVTDRRLNRKTAVNLDFLAYESDGGGAYLFHPKHEAESILDEVPIIRTIKGAFVEEVQVIYTHVRHTISLFDTATVQGQCLHIENKIDLTVKGMMDKEVIMRFSSDIENKHGSFFTDQNGFQLIGRQTNPRRNIETNYYPMTTMALLQDEYRRVTLHSAQSHGVASLKQGQLEVMLDRNVRSDDQKGLGEGVIDNKLTLSKFILHIEHKDTHIPVKNYKFTKPSLVSNIINDHLQQPIHTLFTNVHHQLFGSSFHPVNRTLPCDVSVLSLKTIVDSDLQDKGVSVVVHKKGYTCDYPVTGLQCSVNGGRWSLGSLLPVNSLKNASETTLTHLYDKSSQPLDTDINMEAMDIKTFRIDV